MNKLSPEKRAMILRPRCEGNSMRSTDRVADVSHYTVVKLLVEAGTVCSEIHYELVRNVAAKRVQCDEIWAFCYAKQKNVAGAKAAPPEAGDVWTWTAMDPDTKLVISYLAADRSASSALALMTDLASRLSHRVQLTTDGHKPYLEAVEGVFGADVDYAQLVEIYGDAGGRGRDAAARYSPAAIVAAERKRIEGNPDPKRISTSIVERQNPNMRMGMRRFTRLTNAFSKKLERHEAAIHLYHLYYNFVRIHRSLKITPARRPASSTSSGQWRTSWRVSIYGSRLLPVPEANTGNGARPTTLHDGDRCT